MEKTQKVIVFFIVVLFVWTFAIFFMFNSTLSQLTSEVSSLNESVEENTTQILLLKQRTVAVEIEEPEEDEDEEESDEDDSVDETVEIADNCLDLRSSDSSNSVVEEWLEIIETEFTAYVKSSKKTIGSLCELEDGSYVVSAARGSDDGQRPLIAYYDSDKETVKGAAYEFSCVAVFDSLNPPLIEKIEDDEIFFSCNTPDKNIEYTLELGEDTPKTR